MKNLLTFMLLLWGGLSAFGQSATPTPDDSVLPSTVYGAGFGYARGDANPFQVKAIFAKNFGVTDQASGKKVPSNVYLWTEASTPIVITPHTSPTATNLGAGVAYVMSKSPGGRVLFIFFMTGQLAVAQATGSALGFQGNIGAAIRLTKKLGGVYAMPYMSGSGLASGAQAGSFIGQPGAQLLFGGK